MVQRILCFNNATQVTYFLYFILNPTRIKLTNKENKLVIKIGISCFKKPYKVQKPNPVINIISIHIEISSTFFSLIILSN